MAHDVYRPFRIGSGRGRGCDVVSATPLRRILDEHGLPVSEGTTSSVSNAFEASDGRTEACCLFGDVKVVSQPEGPKLSLIHI